MVCPHWGEARAHCWADVRVCVWGWGRWFPWLQALGIPGRDDTVVSRTSLPGVLEPQEDRARSQGQKVSTGVGWGSP